MNVADLAAVRTRYIARCQIDTLYLHLDLCLQVLGDYGCAPDVVRNPNALLFPSSESLCIIVASWPRPGQSERANYTFSVLPSMVEKVLELTAQKDSVVAADAIGKIINVS